MAVITNTAQGIGQPIRGTTLTSLGSTGIVAAYWDGAATAYHDITVPEFGTKLALNQVAKTAETAGALANVKVWGRVPAESRNPQRNWPVDYDTGFAMGPNGAEIWIPLTVTLSIPAADQTLTGLGAKAGLAAFVDLQGVAEVRLDGITLTAGKIVVARFVN